MRTRTYGPPAALLVLAIAIALTRLHTYDEPLERDLATYAVIGHELLAGRSLYTDLWDAKPPAIYVAYASAEVAVGYGRRAVYALGVMCAVLTLLGVYAAARIEPWGTEAAMWAAACWALLSGVLVVEANQPNAEVFLNACLIASLALLLRVDSDRLDAGRCVSIGVLWALALLFKQVVAPHVGLLAAAHVLIPPSPMSRRRAAAQSAIMLATVVSLLMLVVTYFAATGRATIFFRAIVELNRSDQPLWNLARGLRPDRLIGALWRVAPLPIILFALGAIADAGSRRAITRPWALLCAYVAASYFAIHLSGSWYPHYYQLWLPPLAVGASWGALALAALRPANARMSTMLGGAALVQLLVVIVPAYRWSADEWSTKKYGPVFVEARALARDIRAMLAPEETFYNWGMEPELYYETGQRPPSRVMWETHLERGGGTTLSSQVVADLEAAQPELIVTLETFRHDDPVAEWWMPRYRPHPTQARHGMFRLWVRAGGALEARLRAADARDGG